MKKLLTLFIVIVLFCNFLSAEQNEALMHSANIVIDVLEGNKFAKHLTPQMMDIAKNGHQLPEESKNKLEALGFDFSGTLVVLSRTPLDFFYDTQHFRFHYDKDGYNTVDNTDSDGDGVPNYVETMAEVFEEVYDFEINTLGYTPPPSDGNAGGSNAFDIYIQSIGYYGSTHWGEFIGDNKNSSEIEVNAYASYMKMRNNYDGVQFSHNTELENIQVTAAHEFFHAIQFGYDAEEEYWIMEATATFMEEANYDEVNDCYQYLIPRFEKPHIRLNSSDEQIGLIDYGSFILFKYIEEHLGGIDVIRSVWEQSRYFDGLEADYSIQVLNNALRDYGHSFKLAFNNMAIANCILSSDDRAGKYTYEEAEGYKNYLDYSYYDTVAIELGIHDSLDFYQGSTSNIESYNLQEYGSQYIKVNTNTPVKISLSKPNSENDPLSDLKLHTVRKTTSGNYEIQSGYIQNIDPENNTDWIYAIIVSDGNESSDYNYIVNFMDGVANRNKDFSIVDQYPNPFNNTLTTKLKIIIPQSFDIQVYDILGRKIRTLHSGYLAEGSHDFIWDGISSHGEKVSSGIYYITAKGANRQEWKKVTLIK